MHFIIHLGVSAVILLAVASVVDGFVIENFPLALLAALVLSVVNAIIRPIMLLLTLPLSILSFGLFVFVINALMLKIAAALIPGVAIMGFLPALLAALLLALINALIFRLLPAA